MRKLDKTVKQKTKRPIRIIQYGEGNFLRAFVDWIVSEMNDKTDFSSNVALVQPIENGRVKELSEQDGLYTVITQGISDGKVIDEHKVIDVIDEFIDPYEDYEKYLELAKQDDLRFMISNTTEAGIVYDENDVSITQTPNSFPGKLTALLYTRYKHFNGDYKKGLIHIPCELIDYNGVALKEAVLKTANNMNLESEFIDWIEDANTFCSTLVDRIVTGYPHQEVNELKEKLGYVDHSMVKGEVFHLWVIEGPENISSEFPADKTGLNILFTDNLKPYKERKVRVLNGAHTSMVPVSFLYGIDTVADTVEHEVLGEYVRGCIYDEIVQASTNVLPENELIEFADSVIERFRNPFVRHLLLSISLNSTTKYKTRVLPSVLDYIKVNSKLPKKLLFAQASMIVFFEGIRNGEKYDTSDNQEFLDMYKSLWSNYDGTLEGAKAIAEHVLGLVNHWGQNLNQIDGVTEFIANSIYDIKSKGMQEAIKEVL